MKNLFTLSILILIGSAIFYEPIKFYLVAQEANFAIEKLTYLPNVFADVPEGQYFELRKDVPNQPFVSVTFGTDESKMTFTQSANNSNLNLYLEAVEENSYYRKETFPLNQKTVTVTYFRDNRRRFVLVGNDKRYDLTTNVLDLSLAEVERMEAGLKEIKIDFLKPLKLNLDRLRTYIESFL